LAPSLQLIAYMTPTIRLFLMTALIPVFTGCGLQNESARGLETTTSSSTTTTGASSSFPIPSTSTTTSTSTTSTGTPPLTFKVSAVGYTSTSISVSTGQVLRLKFTPGVATVAETGTSTIPEYSQLGVTISVGSVSQITSMLSNGYNNTTTESSGILDFSAAASGTCASAGTTCRSTVAITVSMPDTDYWCLNYAEMCPYNNISGNQSWNGTLTIQTSDTTSL
jgi:hypothetical protein